MGFRTSVGTLVGAMVLLAATSANAFDENRKGFVVGAGLGSGYAKQTSEILFEDQSTAVFNTDFKIGLGITDQLLVYYNTEIFWYPLSERGESTWIATGLAGIGLSYYLSSSPGTLYLLGSVGISSWAAPFEGENDTLFGPGALGGVGYEFWRHWSVETIVMWGKPDETFQDFFGRDVQVTIDTFSLMVTVTGLMY
jgi:hypothetical protein